MKTVKDYNFTKRHYLGEIYEQRLCILYEHWYLKDQTQTFNFLFKFFEMSLRGCPHITSAAGGGGGGKPNADDC